MSLTTVASILGPILGQSMASDAAEESAQAQIEAAQIAADAAKFRPYGVSTGFGTSWFDPISQKAGYTLDPALAAYRDKMMMGGAQVLGGIELDPTKAAQSYYDEQLAMMQPTRAQQQTELQQGLFGQGRLGMRLAGEAAGAGAGGMYQPDVLGYNKAQALADQQLAAQSRQQALNEIDAALSRSGGMFQTAFGAEQMGMTPLQTGAELGGATASAGANVGQSLLAGGQQAAQARLASGLGWANTLSDIGAGLMKYN